MVKRILTPVVHKKGVIVQELSLENSDKLQKRNIQDLFRPCKLLTIRIYYAKR